MAKVLYVEDDAVLAESVKTWLEIQSHTVETVSSAEDALQLLVNFKYEVILLDWELPGLSGIDFCKSYRQSGGEAWIIFVTAKNDISDLETALVMGGDQFIRKPFATRELSAQISALLRRVDRSFQSSLTIRDFSLKPDLRVLCVNGLEIHLMPKESELLAFLFRNANRSFSTRELLASVWASEKSVTEGVVRTYVRQVRRKLAQIGRNDLIESVQGFGYVVKIERE